MSELIHEDCLVAMRDMEDESIDLIVTDPPYRVTSGSYMGGGGMVKKEEYRKSLVFRHNHITPQEYAPEFFRVLKDGGHCYVMCNNLNLPNMLSTFMDAGFSFMKSLIWEKGNKIVGRWYMSCYEYILMFFKGKPVRINICSTPDVLHIPQKKLKDSNGDNFHDTEKPVALMEVLVKNSSKENEMVLDPFAGIGATCIACKNLGREYIGIEKDDKYFEIMEKRLKNTF